MREKANIINVKRIRLVTRREQFNYLNIGGHAPLLKPRHDMIWVWIKIR